MVVAIGITVLVYGVVGLIVKMDDGGLLLSQRSSAAAQQIGVGLVRGDAEAALGDLGRRHRRDALGRRPHPARRDERPRLARALRRSCTTLEVAAHDSVEVVGAVLGWLVNTAASAVVGLLVGAVVVAVMHCCRSGTRAGSDTSPAEAERPERDLSET